MSYSIEGTWSPDPITVPVAHRETTVDPVTLEFCLYFDSVGPFDSFMFRLPKDTSLLVVTRAEWIREIQVATGVP
jgi:hypothetical protein